MRGFRGSFVLSRGRDGVVVILLADGIGLRKRLVALCLQPGGLGGRRGTVVSRLVQRRIDLVELLPLLHVRAFDEHALQNDAVHLRADLGDLVWDHAAGQIGRQADALRLQCDDFYRYRGGGAGAVSFLALQAVSATAKARTTPVQHLLNVSAALPPAGTLT